MIKKIFFFLNISLIYFFSINLCFADLQKNLINKLTGTKTLSFNFKQKISDKEEVGNCFIKYPLLMKCNYENIKQKTIISDGNTFAIIKRKYKKIYPYPLKSTPLFFILKKEEIIKLIRKVEPMEIDSNLVKFEYTNKKKDKVKIFFDKNSFEFKGWETEDAYSNSVSFLIYNLKINNQIVDSFFKIPKEEEL